METCYARFNLKNSNPNTIDASFGGNIQIHRLSFVNSFCSSIDIRIKTENGFKKVAHYKFGRTKMGFNKCHLLEFKPPVSGSLVRFIISSMDEFYGVGTITNLKVTRSSAIPQKSLLASFSDSTNILNEDGWKILEKFYSS